MFFKKAIQRFFVMLSMDVFRIGLGLSEQGRSLLFPMPPILKMSGGLFLSLFKQKGMRR
jgi:hypothetical protein